MPKTKNSSAYDQNFTEHLINHQIYPPLHELPSGLPVPQPKNADDVRDALAVSRVDVTLEKMPKEVFRNIMLMHSRGASESGLMLKAIPTLIGDESTCEAKIRFSNLEPITENTTVLPKPDFFDGAPSS